MIQNLSKRIKITKVSDYAAANTTDITTDVIDMQGYDGVVFFTAVAVLHSNNYIKLQEGDAANLSDAADLLGTKVAVTVNKEVVGVDLYKPLKRYVRAYIERGGASTACGEVYAMQYEGRILPEDNETAGTLNIELHISPIAGTA